ncbi:RDD family protein [Aliidiomarina sanyensis]|uniref:RDD family protein n=1 Tax=Aliidiomarina sanyensis TaxID=1249555 RepID=A0A432WBI3_9GAMM|nr:RDD family protein [Aliidiomarina sanyensis]RUO29441.1 RDD family protein [Aliidiomarina sanyensis]
MTSHPQSDDFTPQIGTFPRAGFWRRIGAIIYDLLVITAVIMFAAGAGLAVVVGLEVAGLITLAEGQDHAGVVQGNPLFTLYIIGVIILFYAGFWRRGGQTLGMRAWRMRVQNTDGSRVSWKQALIRTLTALLGLGNFWVLFSREKLALQDKVAGCEVVVLSVEANQFKNWKRK